MSDISMPGDRVTMLAPPDRARSRPTGDQTVEVLVDHGYRPQAIVARAGVPLRLIFLRRDADECTDRIVFSSPRIVRQLARGAATTVVLPAQPPGEVRFTCGMGRYHGLIQLKADRPHSFAPLRAAIGRRIEGLRERIRGPEAPSVQRDSIAALRSRFAHGEPDAPHPRLALAGVAWPIRLGGGRPAELYRAEVVP